MALKEVKIEDLTFNPFTKIGKEWMLITAGNEEKHNTMTASWGGVGIMWGMNVATAYIRPQRYTKEFVDAEDMYTLSFFKEEYRRALNLCGTKSGRDCDKDKEAGLTPYYVEGTTTYEEADLVFVCRKLYAQPMKPEFFTVDGPDEKWSSSERFFILCILENRKSSCKGVRSGDEKSSFTACRCRSISVR